MNDVQDWWCYFEAQINACSINAVEYVAGLYKP